MKNKEEKSLQKLIKDINETKFGSTRFIVPYDWLINSLNKPQEIIECKNEIFLNPKKNSFKKDLNKDNMSLVIYEIMEFIISLYKVDYVIKINYNNLQKEIDLDDIDIYSPHYFIKNNINSVEYKKIKVKNTYLKPSDFILNTNNNDINNSKNQLLTNTYHNLDNMDDNEGYSAKIKNKTDSEKLSLTYTNDINKISIKINDKIANEGRNNENKKNNDENREESNQEENSDEFHKNEKLPLNNKKDNGKSKVGKEKNDEEKESKILDIYQNHKNQTRNNVEENKADNENKDINENEHIIENEEYKKYLFNESQLTINLLNYTQESIEPIGLINPRVICFLISVLQTLLSIPELNYYFLSRLYLDNSKNQKDFPKCNAFHHFIKSYLMRKEDNISIPKQLLLICIELLGGMRMHDSQEFLVCFLQALQEELNGDEKYVIPEKASMEQRWIIYRKINNSFIDSVFTGLMRSTVECKNCHHKSQTYDPFIDLSLSINKYSNLEKCLKQFFENEKIDCEYKCDNCKNQVKVSYY